MIDQFHIDPKWDIKEFHNLDYVLATHKDTRLVNEYLWSGHSRTHLSLYNYFEPNSMPSCVYEHIKPKFNFLEKVGIAVNLFKPGQYLPMHTDIFGKYLQIHNAKFEDVERWVVMLEDCVPGQMLQIEKDVFGHWKAGDCFGWKCSENHAFYNMSMINRYAMQITGVRK